MASGTKSGGVFTGNPTGGTPGKSNGMVRKSIGGGGQSILSAYPQDNIHGVSLPDTRGGSFGGSDTNLGHSLSGTAAVQDGAGAASGKGRRKNFAD